MCLIHQIFCFVYNLMYKPHFSVKKVDNRTGVACAAVNVYKSLLDRNFLTIFVCLIHKCG